MKKFFCDRIKVMESRLENRQTNKSTTFFDEKLGMTMQVIGNGLVVPLPIAPEDWERKAEAQQA